MLPWHFVGRLPGLVVHGHSRGGHGAWALATRVPDRVLGVASACGWYSREEYGDANNLWVAWLRGVTWLVVSLAFFRGD